MQTIRKTIVVPGASSDLDADMTREFVARGHNPAPCARRPERLKLLRDEVKTLVHILNVMPLMFWRTLPVT